ncbi:hypothetical protein BKA65DRAFT_510045 [Rhexocercosporidium sp. MPI-PUGE-AT-0058]|nr:hypothetical protein BKA65DRAFT_510045 [Rhexocercosporidium sp. MPI-PUGE-AT-0058]
MDGKQSSPTFKPEAAAPSRDAKHCPPKPTSSDEENHPSLLVLILPPTIGLLGMTPEQRRQQIFPYSMPPKDGNIVYSITGALSLIFFRFQAQTLESYFPYDQRDSITALFVWWVFILQFRIGIYSCLYPFLYACLLRARSGQWPSRIQVLGSYRAQEIELERGGGARKSGVVALLGLWMSYTWAGVVLINAWTAWKEGLGQEEFIREKRMRELEEVVLMVEEEKTKRDGGARQEESHENEKDGKDEEA